MTYCVGLRTKKGVFIAADSVFSSATPSTYMAAASNTTVFGEQQGNVGLNSLRYVSEEGLKVSVGDGAVVGFAGDVDTARALTQAYFDGRKSSLGHRDAVNVALLSVTPCEGKSEVLFAFYEGETPCLLLVDTSNQSTHDVEGLVQLGSELSSGQHEWTAKFVTSFLRLLDQLGPHPLHTERMFTNLVALLQSYGVHDYLLKYGVGGAFVAAWVTPAGARWQGDHLYQIHGEIPVFEDPMCATMVRDDLLCLINNQTNSNKLVGWARPSHSPEETNARGDAALKTCLAAWDSGTFDYFISINSAKHIVTIVEMRGNQHHALVSLHVSHIAERLGIVWTMELIARANTIALDGEPDSGHMTVNFFPFQELSTEEQFEREQFGWEGFVEWNGEPGEKGIAQ
ncbi:hypothetical protein RAE21_11775 [Rhodoferax sp. TBRC 17198]|uniref:hypothetical protein n=1 Tax=Rhodoferax potami TaxID=3068338 RepID=UPI0028BEB6D7|nr:hypothetical protein [Rhodoferax sp. TBRC 17198]MDT7523084.1 hypothetical protein [Rhodoferax sp. TBRC 17198]